MDQLELHDDARTFFQTVSSTMGEWAFQISETEDAVGRLVAQQSDVQPALSEPLQAIDRISQKLQQLAFCLEAAADEVEWPDGPPPRLYEVRLLDDLRRVLVKNVQAAEEKPSPASGDIDLFG